MNCLPLEPLNIIIRGQMSYQHATEVNTRDKPVYGQEIVFHKYNTNGWGKKNSFERFSFENESWRPCSQCKKKTVN